MIKIREVPRVVEYDVSPVDTVNTLKEATMVREHVNTGPVKTNKAQVDALNGLIEAFFVTTMREVPSNTPDNTLTQYITHLKNTFGTDYAVLNRAIARVKKFRGKNPAFRG